MQQKWKVGIASLLGTLENKTRKEEVTKNHEKKQKKNAKIKFKRETLLSNFTGVSKFIQLFESCGI